MDLTPVTDILSKEQAAKLNAEPKIDIKSFGGLVAAIHPASAPLMKAVSHAGDDDVYDNQDLADLSREYITISAMVASDASDELVATHLYAALRLGASPGQVANTLLLAGAYSGFQRYVRYLTVYRRVLFHLKRSFDAGVFDGDLAAADKRVLAELVGPMLATEPSAP